MRGYGKVILFGEHAVVYGYPALAMGLTTGIEAHFQEPDRDRARSADSTIRLVAAAWNLQVDSQGEDTLGKMLRSCLAHLPPLPGGSTIVLEPHLPAGAGLGSSAAMAVAIIRTWLDQCQVSWPDREINELAFRLETLFHGTPSGLDNTMATYGGLCCVGRFTTPFPYAAQSIREVAIGELKAYFLPPQTLPLVIGNTQCPRQTRELVAGVRKRLEENPGEYNPVLQEIGSLAVLGYEALWQHDEQRLGQLLQRNQQLLQRLGVSSPQIERLCSLAQEAGALGAKLTGAGGGGCVIALAPQREEAVLQAWAQAGFAGFISER